MAQQTLKYIMGPARTDELPSIPIVRAVAERFSLYPSQLKMKSNTRQIAYPRQIAMYLVKELTHASFPEIGRPSVESIIRLFCIPFRKSRTFDSAKQDLNSLIQSLINSFQ